MTRELKYFGYVKRLSGFKRRVMEGGIPGNRGRGRPIQKWAQDIEDFLGMGLQRAGELATSQESC